MGAKGGNLVVRNAAQLLTMAPPLGDGPLGIIRGGSLAIKDGSIIWVGPDTSLPAELISSGVAQMDVSGKVAAPGFVDSHTHLLFAGSREDEFAMRVRGKSYAEIAAAGGGIVRTVESVRKASQEELVTITRPRLRAMLAQGTTTAEAKSGYGLNVVDELKMLRAIRSLNDDGLVELVPTFLGAHEVPMEYRGRREEYVRLIIEEMIPAVAREGLAQFCDVFCEKGVFSFEESEMILKVAAAHGLIPKVHADELNQTSGAELAARLGAASADHLLYASDDGLKMMAEAGVVATLLPGTAFFLGLPYAPARKMFQFGLNVALASDFNPGSCTTFNLPLIMTMACTQMKMTPEEALLAVTVNGARAIRLEDRVGSLQVGKQGDVAILDMANYLNLVYFFGTNPVEVVVKRGRVVYSRALG